LVQAKLRTVLTAGGCAILGVGGLLTASSGAAQQPVQLSAPTLPGYVSVSETDAGYVMAALTAGRAGNGDQVRGAMGGIQDPTARKIALWALADGAPQSMSFFELDAARRDLAGWPRSATRQINAEKKLETSGLDPARIVAWFGGGEPQTVEGVMALAAALRAQGSRQEASDLIRRWWRTRLFDVDPQRSMRARFSDLITADDNAVRTDMLLYGQQGPAARDMVDSLYGPDRNLADARMALRSGRSDANDLVAGLTAEQRKDPGLIYEQAVYFHKRGMTGLAYSLAGGFRPPPAEEVAIKLWPDKKRMLGAALQEGNARAAYDIANNSGMIVGADAAEAEFFAGWLALTRLNNPAAAARHFANLAAAGVSPITQGRALYWQGRAAEALGDKAAAQAFYLQGSKYITVFYGQLAAEKAGIRQVVLEKDPVITQADRSRFEGREVVRAAKMLNSMGARDQFKVFVLHLDDVLPTAAEAALLVDMARATGDQDLAMRAVRTAAQRGFILPERGYPVLPVQSVPGAAEPAFVLSITRQESNFDPRARSGADARGMMQLLPATGRSTARSLGESFTPERLYEPEFNMRLGARYLGDMTNTFGGSYAMAAAAYNAGPGRPAQWIGICGDPRGSASDPLNFIECIPFSETRNYVMRTLETTQIYRARLNGGRAPLQLSTDLKRGGYSYSVVGTSTQ
jgi:soluble lytic murein transglycosylase